MTTIAYRDGVLAADSVAWESTKDAGAILYPCEKLYTRHTDLGPIVFGTAGESAPALAFVNWYGTKRKRKPREVMEGDFSIIMCVKGEILIADQECEPEPLVGEFFAIGSGRKAALGALHAGTDAATAVAIACRIDPYSREPVKTIKVK